MRVICSLSLLKCQAPFAGGAGFLPPLFVRLEGGKDALALDRGLAGLTSFDELTHEGGDLLIVEVVQGFNVLGDLGTGLGAVLRQQILPNQGLVLGVGFLRGRGLAGFGSVLLGSSGRQDLSG